MAAGPNISGPRGFSVVTNPERFTNSPQERYRKNTTPELLVFNNQSNSTGDVLYSSPIVVNPAEGFSVHAKGTGNVLIEVAISPESGFWTVLNTINGSGFYSTNSYATFIRIGLANGASNSTVWVYRKYSTY